MDRTTEDSSFPLSQDDSKKTNENVIQKSIKIFFCYAHEDELLLRDLQAHLSALKRLRIVDLWYDRDISAGSERQQEINYQLDTAQIILLLVSPDFINSDYCYSIEMERAIVRHQRGEARVIPIILRPVYWQGTPFGDLQVLPTDGKPIRNAEWYSKDDAFFDVAEGIRRAVEEVRTRVVVNTSPTDSESSSERRKKEDIQSTVKKQDVQIDNVPYLRPIKENPPLYRIFISRLNYRRSMLVLCLSLTVLGGFSGVGWFGIARQHQIVVATATAAAKVYEIETDKGVQYGIDPAHTHWNHSERLINAANVNSVIQIWSYPAGGAIGNSPVVVNGMIYIGSHDHRIYAFDVSCRSDCRPIWSYPTDGDIFSSPAAANGIIYIGSRDDKFYAFNATCRSDCMPIWSYSTGGGIGSSPVVANGMVYVGSDDDGFYAFDASCRSNCRPIWSYLTSGNIFSSPAVANGMVYVGSLDHNIYAFDENCHSDCTPIWSYRTDGYVRSSPTIANGVVYIGSDDHRIYAFDASCRITCKPIWSYFTNGAIESGPAVANGMIYVGSNGGTFYAFGIANLI